MTVFSSYTGLSICTILVHCAARVESRDADHCGQNLQSSKFFKGSLLQVEAIAEHSRSRIPQRKQKKASLQVLHAKNESESIQAINGSSPTTLQLFEAKVKTHRQDIQDFAVLSMPFLAIMFLLCAGLCFREQTDKDATTGEWLQRRLNKLASKKDAASAGHAIKEEVSEDQLFRIRPFIGDMVKVEKPRKDLPAHVYYTDKVGTISVDNGSEQPFQIAGMTRDPSTGISDVWFFEDEVTLVKRAQHHAKSNVSC